MGWQLSMTHIVFVNFVNFPLCGQYSMGKMRKPSKCGDARFQQILQARWGMMKAKEEALVMLDKPAIHAL